MDFWGNKDFIVFRERSPLAAPLSVSLKARAEAATWADDGPAAMPAVHRLAVTPPTEALLLLPAGARAPPPPAHRPRVALAPRPTTDPAPSTAD